METITTQRRLASGRKVGGVCVSLYKGAGGYLRKHGNHAIKHTHGYTSVPLSSTAVQKTYALYNQNLWEFLT